MDIKELEEIELNRDANDLIIQNLVKTDNCFKNKLHIVYIMIWTKVCGGSKIILEYANRLSREGDDITIITYDNKPDWFKLDENVNFIKVDSNKKISDYIPQCDVIIATSWKCIYDAIQSNKAPVVFFEQGGAHLFDIAALNDKKKEVVKHRFRVVPFIYTVSEYAKDIINKEYNRCDVEVIYNAVDSNIFYPRNITNKDEDVIRITIIGSEDFKFKNIEGILQAMRILSKEYNNIQLNWITQTEPKKNKEKAIINPTQKQIGDILRNTDIYICNSQYESFGLPTLEAMTCGAAVITTDTGGMRDFVVNNKNAIVINKNDEKDIVEKVKMLIENKEKMKLIAQEGMKTALEFNWDNSIKKVREYYKEIASYKVK